jgi:23S rRNA pseudouridine2604 synthase
MKIKVDLFNYKEKEKKDGIRVNKFLAESGILSRREADKLISQNKVHINDRVAILGEKVRDGDSVILNYKLERLKYFIYNKKRGEETTFKIKENVRYEPIGRLDKESEGLLIYSNDYKIVEKLLNPKNKIEREYLVRTREKATPRVKTILERGINTLEAKYAPAKKVVLDEENKNTINIVLLEGKKHEIRRMLNALNLTITSLKRIRFAFLKLQNLKPGELREMKKEEIYKLTSL